MSDDDSSDLSSVPSDVEEDLQLTKKDGILKFFSKVPKPKPQHRSSTPPRPKREPSPPHEYVLADNPDIAFIVMFRSRFTEAFPKSLPTFGPQELERDVVDTVPGEGVEHLLCAVLGLLLNRKQDVKAGHYNRALEEAIQTHKSQWAKDWESKNPLSGGQTFTTMSPTERLTLLKTLISWSLSSSDIVRGIIATSYKQNRHEDDLNQPLSVQPWGSDGDKRRYYLIEGLDDTHFRVYRESNHMAAKRTWWSVASDIDESKGLAEKLVNEDGGQKAKVLSGKILAAVPRFEATEEKRKRREYRQIRKQQFKRPEPNYSMYEGRTRGKRIRYTYSDEEDLYDDSDTAFSRRSTRNTGTTTPAEGLAPTVTLSGRQVKARQGGTYGESMLSGAHIPGVTLESHDGTSEEPEQAEGAGRPRRAAAPAASSTGWNSKGGAHIEGYNSIDENDSDEDDASEQDYGDDEEEDEQLSLASDKDEDKITDQEQDIEGEDDKQSLVVKLPVKTPTPERKTVIKLRVSPEKDVVKPVDFGESAMGEENKPNTTSALGSSAFDNESIKPSAFASSSTHVASVASAIPTNLPPKSPSNATQAAPLSPLVFRGSPEKPPHAFPHPSINVGYGGS
ncbi:hypothetical protein D0Z07_5448 [Hyphodiscus hymeniophilus]|uniref:WHIM1 domain-containing protein n=1 Tax=Hyphodiscus hymeniophilus TaxID=353542 RepID=A0A9P7AWD2_9HELO|nr:hypothetical protein D0Z07_5448 [Hyphodiscus hymeniophilus]